MLKKCSVTVGLVATKCCVQPIGDFANVSKCCVQPIGDLEHVQPIGVPWGTNCV